MYLRFFLVFEIDLIAVYFPLNDHFCCIPKVVVYFVFIFMYFWISLIFLLTQSLFRRMFFSHHVFLVFPIFFFLWLTTRFMCCGLKICMVWSPYFLYFLRADLWSSMYYILENVLCAVKMDVYSIALDEMFWLCLLISSGPVCHSKPLFACWFSA